MKREVLVFTAAWCPQCPTMKALLNECGVDYRPIDVDEQEGMDLAGEWKVRGLPTVIILENDMIVNRFTGLQTKEVIESQIKG